LENQQKIDLNQIKIITERSYLNKIKTHFLKCDSNQNQIDEIIY